MNYNTQLPHLIISEYGRNVQSMVDHCCTIEARDERNRCARAIIQVMGQLNPHLRDIPDFTHKLWDHLFVISKFTLDVDSPYPKPSAETFVTKPKNVAYPKGKIKYRHYGKIIEDIIEKAKDFKEGEEKEVLKRTVATQLKKSYLNWNKDTVLDEVIFKHLAELSGGALKMDESEKLLDSSDLIKRGPLNISNNPSNKKHHKKHHKNFKRK
ncbi:MAG TPA: DUF4290 domain-containing protein [Bacteroidia bacterium]|jgi:hypothetical protein|nr:DUF4290 domain-containing protein [Bacteroidia bacterium]